MQVEFINFDYDGNFLNVVAGKYNNDMTRNIMFKHKYLWNTPNIEEYINFVTKVRDFENTEYYFNINDYIKYDNYSSSIELNLNYTFVKLTQNKLPEELRNNICAIIDIDDK